MNLKQPFIYCLGVLLVGCSIHEHTPTQNTLPFEGEIVYHATNQWARDPNREFIQMDYDHRYIFTVTSKTVTLNNNQNPLYLQALDSALKHRGEAYQSIYLERKENLQETTTGSTKVYDFETSQMIFFPKKTLHTQDVMTIPFKMEMPHHTYHKIRQLKGDTTILGYPCKLYELTKINGLKNKMWITDKIKAYLPPQTGVMDMADKDDEKKMSLRTKFFTLREGVCLWAEIEEWQSIVPDKIDKTILKVISIKPRKS